MACTVLLMSRTTSGSFITLVCGLMSLAGKTISACKVRKVGDFQQKTTSSPWGKVFPSNGTNLQKCCWFEDQICHLCGQTKSQNLQGSLS